MTVPSYPSGAAEQPASSGPAPKEVETAFRLWLANVVLGLIAAILSFAASGPIVDQIVKQQPNIDRSTAEAAARAGLVVGAVVGIILIGLYLLFAFKMRAGRNWARITLTVLGGISALLTLIGIGTLGALFSAGGAGVVNALITIAQLVLILAAIYLMFRPAANQYFKAPTYS